FSLTPNPSLFGEGLGVRLKGVGVSALFALHYFTLYYQQYQYPQSTFKQLPPFPWLTTPLSLRRGAGGEALSLCKQSINNLTLRANKGGNGG
ncbi:MAG: hypothetical protein HXN96_08515, partial [Prevotella salivae]|nr:hypothetical protein [Segatella salivae]